jgi:threonine dehydrogenase-like Zn-dependent dehydrogenase
LAFSGAGPIGLVSLLSARAAGAEPIVITDLFQSRLDFAKKLVPGVRTVLVERGLTPKDAAQKVKDAADGPVKLAIECSGVESSVHTAVHVRNSEVVCAKNLAYAGWYPGSAIWWQSVHHWCRQERTSGM